MVFCKITLTTCFCLADAANLSTAYRRVFVSDIVVCELKSDVELQPTNQPAIDECGGYWMLLLCVLCVCVCGAVWKYQANFRA